MDAIKKIHHKDSEILVVDYTGRKTAEMVELLKEVSLLIQAENKQVLILTLFQKNYITSDYVRTLEKELKIVEHLIDKNAVIGLTEVQKWILKGVNLWYRQQIHHFDSYDKALAFLVEPVYKVTQ